LVRQRTPMTLALIAIAAVALWLGIAPSAMAKSKTPIRFTVMNGYPDPATPPSLNKVGVLKFGAQGAPNVLILNPGTSAGAGYFAPLARTITKMLPDWQVWSVERRENFLEDQSELNLLKQGRVSATALFNYYLGYLSNPSINPHYQPVPNSQVPFARGWGMNVEVNDLRIVARAAAKGGRNVAMGGHSLGGSITTAYATWDFNGRARGREPSRLV